MTELYLLRHGPTEAAAQGAPLGRLDLPVNGEGEARWPAVKAALQGFGLQRVLCSPLQRSRRHAEDLGLPSLVLEGLAEQAFGAWEGRPWSEVSVSDPAASKAFFADPVRAAPPGGESFARCASRAVLAFRGAFIPSCAAGSRQTGLSALGSGLSLISECPDPGSPSSWEGRIQQEPKAQSPEPTAGFGCQEDGPLLVLAHGGSLRALLAHFLGLPLDRALDLGWSPFGLSLMEAYGPNRGLLRFHNRVLASTSAP